MKILIRKSILLKLVYIFSEILTKIPARCFVHIDKIILKLIWKSKGTIIGKTILGKNNKEDTLHLISKHSV